MFSRERQRVVLADHIELASDVFARFGDLSDPDVLITYSALDAGLRPDLESAGPRVVLA